MAGRERRKERKKGTYVFFWEVFSPGTKVAISFWHLAFTRARPVARYGELAHLEFRVRDRTTGDARVGRPVESAVEDVLAPAVHVILVDVMDAAVLDHDFVGRGCEQRSMVGGQRMGSSGYEGSRWLPQVWKYSRRSAWGSVTTYPRKMSGSGYDADMIL